MRTTGERPVLVTTVIPARSTERYLGEAIESVVSQTVPPDEVVVVVDEGSDTAANIARSFGAPVRCLRHAPSGAGAALNRGLAEARGELVTFLDADDLWTPGKNEAQLQALSEDGTLDMVFGQIVEFHSPELTSAERSQLLLRSDGAPGVCKGAMIVRRRSLQRVGGFATQWSAGEFVDWYARAVDAGLKGAVLPDVVLRRRLHRDNQSRRATTDRGDYARVLKAVLDRRRADVT